MRPAGATVTTADGVRLALTRVGPPGGPPVVLSHGAYSNSGICIGMAQHLGRAGFTCWLFDWRGRGASSVPAAPVTFEQVALFDVPCVIDAVMSRSGGRAPFWVGHSGGGLVASMWMARFPQCAMRSVKGLVMVGSQATGAAPTLRARLRLQAYDWCLRFSRVAPGRALRLGPENESAAMMRQWCAWNLERAFLGDDGFNYMTALARVTLPVLSLAGAGDWLVAPPAGCRELLTAFGTRDAQFHHCAAAEGFCENYSHSRLFLSTNASKEIWPLIARWLSNR